MPSSLVLDGHSLTLDQVWRASHAGPQEIELSIHPQSLAQMKESRQFVSQILDGQKPIYSINTGFGALSDKRIKKEDLSALQYNLIRSHCTGIGPAFGREVSRAVMLLRANCLVAGLSGIGPRIVELLIDFLNLDIIPVIPQKGSVGASGDLAPLAHVALALIGEGEVTCGGKVLSGDKALKSHGKTPAVLGAKDGLALINGTAVMGALASLAVVESERLAKLSDIACALSLEAMRGTSEAFHEGLHLAKPHEGQVDSAFNLRLLLKESEIASSHKDCPKVQDPYSLRCAPQVHGASRETITHAKKIAQVEINAVTDNPLVFSKSREIVSGGNFHGQALALSMDYLAMGLSELANIAERRIEKMMNPYFSDLPGFLTHDSGLHSGLMIAQVSAAALVGENKVLCHPASVDSIPTSGDKEDHVSMGVTSGRKLHEILENVKQCLAIEFLCNTQGLEFLKPLSPPAPLKAVYDLIRRHVPPIRKDRPLHKDIALIKGLIDSNAIVETCERVTGKLR
ncbi:MAG: histidine ammonia-lyase [Bacteriovoracales bacterium]|nr:histidine ammonia-lyase [Bacteriovoracales bacterium]